MKTNYEKPNLIIEEIILDDVIAASITKDEGTKDIFDHDDIFGEWPFSK